MKTSIKLRIKYRLIRLIQNIRIFVYQLLSTAAIEGRPILSQPVFMVGRGRIIFSDGVRIGVWPSPHYFSGAGYIEARNESAAVWFGDGVQANNNLVVIAEHKTIRIGKRCLIGPQVEIYDSDFHGVLLEERHLSLAENAADVTIGDDVFIGSNVKILKGAEIGAGAVIGSGAVVVGKVPANVLAAGVPARVIRELVP